MSGSSGSHQLAGAHVSTKQMSGSSGSHQLAGAHVSVQLLFSRTRMALLLWIKLRKVVVVVVVVVVRKVVVVVVVGKVDAQPCNGKHQTRHRTIQ
jgi:Ser-tRNA(Ala) deacylase AlaX